MSNRSETFGRLLKGAINSIAAYEGKSAPAVEEELGAQIGVAGSAIQRYKAGNLPPEPRAIQILAEAAVRRGFLSRAWLLRFLQAARYPTPETLVAQLADVLGADKTTVPTTLPSGTLAFLFTDIAGSTMLWEQQPQAMERALGRHDTILRQTIDAYGGQVFKTVGDAFYAVFSTTSDALDAAFAVQRALATEAWGPIGTILVRMAIHVGTAQQRDGDYFGPPLNRVARLLSSGHGGQILLSLSAQELVRDLLPSEVALRDLGEHRLKDLGRPERIFQAVTPDVPSDFPPLRTLDSYRHNLPSQPTPFIGREEDIQVLVDILRRSDTRLLTLTGPGGIGKTRLAIQAAAELLDAFRDGVSFVPLASVHEPDLVLPAIAQVLGVVEAVGRPLAETIAAFLRPQRMLLILDNFEQVAAAAPQIAKLLVAAPGIKALITSREVMHLYGEREYIVPPLALPDVRRLPPIARLTQYEAVRLFIERAQDVRSDFAITAENAPAIAEICTRLDGLPLAIELAAARCKLFPPKALLSRLDKRLNLLTGGARDLPARQQTLRSAIAWSYDLLDAADQALFARLGVFAGGCTLEAAEVVLADDISDTTGELAAFIPADAILGGLESLIDKSLLRQVEASGDEPRFMMLETIREFALERLAQSGEEETIRYRHATYCVSLLSQIPEGGFTNWFNRMNLELDNIRAVLSWALATDHAVPALLIGAEFFFWENHISEGRRWIQAALALPSAATFLEERRGAFYSEGTLARAQGDYAAARAAFEECQRVAELLGSPNAWADRWSLAWCDIAERDYAGALAHFQAVFDEGRQVATEHPFVGAWMRQGLAAAASLLGDHTRALALNKEALDIFQSGGRLIASTISLVKLGYVARAAADTATARRYFARAHEQAQALGYSWRILSALAGLAGTAQVEGDSYKAARLFGAAEAMQETMSILLDPDEIHLNERLIAETKAQLGEDAFLTAWAEGQALPLEQAIAEALAAPGSPVS